MTEVPWSTEAPNPETAHIDTLGSLDIVRLMNREDARVASAIASALPAVAAGVDLLVDRLSRGGRVFYVGAGTSGRIGVLDAAEWSPTFGVPPGVVQVILAGGPAALLQASEEAEDDGAAGAAAVRRHEVGAADAVVGLSASGRSPFVLEALRAARKAGAGTIGVACNRPSPLEALCDVSIISEVGPEVIAGSTRLKAGTAQKMILNMLSTAAMVRLGRVYRNLMVDLAPTNRKLLARAVRTVALAGGVSQEQAEQLLEAAGRRVKLAIVMARTGLPAPDAAALLEQHGGFVRRALAAFGVEQGEA